MARAPSVESHRSLANALRGFRQLAADDAARAGRVETGCARALGRRVPRGIFARRRGRRSLRLDELARSAHRQAGFSRPPFVWSIRAGRLTTRANQAAMVRVGLLTARFVRAGGDAVDPAHAVANRV